MDIQGGSREPVSMGFYYWKIIFGHQKSDILIEAYEMNYVVEGKNWPDQTEPDFPFFNDLKEDNYVVYQNEMITVSFYRNNYE